jgi:hypothetical protein
VLPNGFKPKKREHFGNTCIQTFVFKQFIHYKYQKTQPHHATKTVKSVAGSIKTEPKSLKTPLLFLGGVNWRAPLGRSQSGVVNSRGGKKRYQTIRNDTT